MSNPIKIYSIIELSASDLEIYQIYQLCDKNGIQTPKSVFEKIKELNLLDSFSSQPLIELKEGVHFIVNENKYGNTIHIIDLDKLPNNVKKISFQNSRL